MINTNDIMEQFEFKFSYHLMFISGTKKSNYENLREYLPYFVPRLCIISSNKLNQIDAFS